MFPTDGVSRDFRNSHHQKPAAPDIDIDKINN